MASASTSQDHFHCSICLDVFTEPVSTPCGHNFCRSCINGYWATKEVKQCPLCMQTYVSAPQLRVNSEFRDILELFKRTGAAGGDRSPPGRPSGVPCDLCPGARGGAVKSCLICLASYCDAHLEPHRRVQALKWHKLIRPVVSLENRACKKHSKLKEFFCRREKIGVCAACLRDDHALHDVVSVEEELQERRTQLALMKVRVNQNMEAKIFSVQRLQRSVKQRRQKVERIKSEVIKSFGALVALVESHKVELVELLEGQQRSVEQEAEELIQRLQVETAENQRISKELEELSQCEDDYKLLQGLPSVSAGADAECSAPRDHALLQVETVKAAVARAEEVLNEQVENIFREVSLTEEEEPADPPTDKAFNDALEKIQRECATRVTLDPNTAHPSLIVSQDRKQVRHGGSKRNVPDNPSRFDRLHYVLGKEGFSAGRSYYEVSLQGQTTWEIGVTRETIGRKRLDLSLTPESGCWTLGCYWGRCQANANPPVVLPQRPEKVGVFVDLGQRVVSFYDMDNRALLYSFTGCSFSAPGDGSLWSSWTYTAKPSTIYPIFRPSSEEAASPLRISAVRRTKRKERIGSTQPGEPAAFIS